MRKNWKYLAGVLLAWVIYASYYLATPLPDNSPYDISPTALSIIKISILLPFLAIWVYSLTAWLRLKTYTSANKNALEYPGYIKIQQGLLVLLVGLILPTLIRGIMLYYFKDLDADPNWIRFYNYFNLIFPITAFILMLRGSADLLKVVRINPKRISRALSVFMPIALFSFFYGALVFTNPARQSPIDSVPATYYLPDYLIVLTIMVPVIVTWVSGLMLALNLEQYSRKAPPAHRPAMANFYNGILAIVASSILAQAISSLGSARFAKASLGLILIIIYILFGTIAVGYGLIARGASKLPKASFAKFSK